MKLFAYGCSFTYGSELADADFANMSIKDTDLEKEKLGERDFYHKYVERINKKEEYRDLMFKRSYAQHIANSLGLESYINRARPGGSNTYMFYRIMQDINSGIIEKDDIIFVGFTSLNRYTWYDKNSNEFIPTTVAGGPWPNAKFQKQYILNVSDKEYILNGIQTYYAIKEITKEFRFFYQTTQWPYTHTYNQYNAGMEFWKILKEIDDNSLLPETCLFYDMPKPNEWKKYSHAFGHPYKEYHESYGKKLGAAILEKI